MHHLLSVLLPRYVYLLRSARDPRVRANDLSPALSKPQVKLAIRIFTPRRQSHNIPILKIPNVHPILQLKRLAPMLRCFIQAAQLILLPILVNTIARDGARAQQITSAHTGVPRGMMSQLLKWRPIQVLELAGAQLMSLPISLQMSRQVDIERAVIEITEAKVLERLSAMLWSGAERF